MKIKMFGIDQGTGEETLEWDGEFADFVANSELGETELEECRAMLSGPEARCYIGGGAAALFLLMRVSR